MFMPVLDFDPLPRGMPLHGWLLEPWRRAVRKMDDDTGTRVDDLNLTERLADLFDRAVTGWTSAEVSGKGVAEKVIAYQEQASGWLDTSKAVERVRRCNDLPRLWLQSLQV